MSDSAVSAPGPPAGVQDPIPRALLRLTLPVMASYTLRLAYQWVDALWVRGLGVEATAAVTTSVFVMWWVYSLNDVFAIGVTAFTSQLLGAGDRGRAGVAAYKGLRASAALGLVAMALGLFGARQVYALLDPDPTMTRIGASFLSIMLAGSPLLMMSLTCESIMRAAGDTRTPLLIDLCAVGLNALLDPILIYGWGPLRGHGVAGAAMGSVAAWAVMLAGYLWMAARGHRAFPFARRAPGPPVRIAGMARVGIPAALVGTLFSVVYIAFSRSASRFGAPSLAVIGIANRIEALQFTVAVAIGSAGASLVGQNLGAGQPERAALAIRTGLVWVSWSALAVTAVLLAFPAFLLDLFSHDPGVRAVGVPYLRVLAACMWFTAVEIVTAESIMGSGHTAVMSWIYTTVSLIRIPLAFAIPDWTGSGVIGIAWVITVTCAVRSVLLLGWAARGTWKRGLARELHGGAASPEPPIG